MVAERLLGPVSGKELGAAPPEAALRHHAGVGVEKGFANLRARNRGWKVDKLIRRPL